MRSGRPGNSSDETSGKEPMSDLRELYQQVILDHSKSPRNFRSISNATRQVEGYNPLCGDKLILYLKIDGDTVVDAAFQGSGCAISTASASLLTQIVKGKAKSEAGNLVNGVIALLTGKSEEIEDAPKLMVLSGVKQFPARVKCAALCWHSLEEALVGDSTSVSTE